MNYQWNKSIMIGIRNRLRTLIENYTLKMTLNAHIRAQRSLLMKIILQPFANVFNVYHGWKQNRPSMYRGVSHSPRFVNYFDGSIDILLHVSIRLYLWALFLSYLTRRCFWGPLSTRNLLQGRKMAVVPHRSIF